MQEITDLIKKTVQDEFGQETEPIITIPDPKFGDFSTNIAMQLAKLLKDSPANIANQLIKSINSSNSGYQASMAGPGFINLSVTSNHLKRTLDQNWHEAYGNNNDGAGKTVIVEYPSQNMAKPYSVGHLRPGNQGWAAKKLMEATGWNVITDNHLGDCGSPFGVWVTGFLRFSSNEQLAEGGVYELGRIYIEMKKVLKEESAEGKTALADEVQSWLLRLEKEDPEAVEFSKRFCQISLGHIHDVMNRLKISTDYEYGELFFAPMGKKLVQKYLDSGIFEQNTDGSVICRLDDYGIEVPLLVLKSNGAALYATTDLATMVFREQEFKPDRIIHAVGSEQKFYFEQLFAMSKKIGLGHIQMDHLWFGVIDQLNEDGTREKMSSRKGVVLMEELLDKAEQKARDLVGDREVAEEDIKKIALGAIKFSDFAADRRTNILFDWNTIFALTGYSGPYVQYAAVRLNKIINDNQDFVAIDFKDYGFEPEKSLIKLLLEYPDVVRRATESLEMHKIANFAYRLARATNKYYEDVNVSKAPDTEKSARLELLKQVSQVFTHSLDILGIEVPENM